VQSAASDVVCLLLLLLLWVPCLVLLLSTTTGTAAPLPSRHLQTQQRMCIAEFKKTTLYEKTNHMQLLTASS
jgi:hypothetical protein